MPGGYGFASHVGVARENSFGTAPDSITDFVEALSESMQESIERFETRVLIGAMHEPDDAAGLHTVEGDIEFSAHPESIGHFLAAAFGVSSTGEVASGELYQHTFTPRTNDLENQRAKDSYSFEMFRHDVTSSFLFTGGVVSKITFDMQINQALQITASVVAKSLLISSASTPTFPGSPVDPFTFDTVSISWAGAASEIYEGLAIDFETPMAGNPRLIASNEVFAIKRDGPYMGRITATLAFDDLDEFARWKNQNEAALVVVLQKASSFQLIIDCPRVVWTSYPVAAGGADRIVVEAEGRLFQHVGSGEMIEVNLWNTTSGYVLADNGLS